jgi:hypothetical protein
LPVATVNTPGVTVGNSEASADALALASLAADSLALASLDADALALASLDAESLDAPPLEHPTSAIADAKAKHAMTKPMSLHFLFTSMFIEPPPVDPSHDLQINCDSLQLRSNLHG